MRKIISITFVTLDGVMQAPGGPGEDPSNGFAHGGWTAPLASEAGMKEVTDIIAGEFDLLLGRRTYEIFAGHWPHQGDHPIAKAFNKATKYVATRTLNQLDWKTSRRLGEDVVVDLRQVKASDGPPLHVWGSSDFLQTLIAADLIDEYRVWIFPLILGAGKRLFERSVPPRALTLVATRSTPTGVLINTYRLAGPVKTGSF